MPGAPALVIGSPVSPYVRKVLAVLEMKGLDYEIDPIVPFFGDERFEAMSPLRRVPAYRDDLVTLCDSTVICEYLEDRFPAPSLRPADLGARADSRWIEEYADTRMGDVCIWRLYYPRVVRPKVFGAEGDDDAIAKTHAEELPQVMDYLEARLNGGAFLCGPDLSIGDIAAAVHFANLRWAKLEPDWARRPQTAAWLTRVREETPLQRLEKIADVLVHTPFAERRAVAEGLGMRIAAETTAGRTPQRGPMTV